MAKFCFYCGQELASGEKCKCKGKNSRSSSASSSANSGAYGAGTSKASSTRTSSGNGPKAAGSGPKIRTSRSRKPHGTGFRLKTFTDQLRTLFPTLSSGAVSGANYVLRPATKIRSESLRAKRPFSFVTVLVFMFLAGLLAILMIDSDSHLFVGMLVSIFGQKAIDYCAQFRLQSFFVVSGVALLFVAVLTTCFYVGSRFSNRKPTFRKTFDLVTISLVYVELMEIVLLITILFGSNGSISLIFISLILMALAQLLSFRNALGLTEDSIFQMLFFVYVTSYLVIKLSVFILVTALF